MRGPSGRRDLGSDRGARFARHALATPGVLASIGTLSPILSRLRGRGLISAFEKESGPGAEVLPAHSGGPAGARERIAQLGDPAFIAAEARGETRVNTAERKSGRESRAYVIIAAVAIAVGGYIVPVAVGLVTSAFLFASGSAGFAWWNVLVALSIANLGVAVWLLVRAFRRS